MTFANPAYFLLLLLLIPWIVWYFLFRSKSESHILWASTEALRRVPHTWRTRLVHLPFFLRTVLYRA